MKNKFEKIIIAFIVVLSSFCISLSAVTPATAYYCYFQKPQLNGKNFYLEITTSNNWQVLVVGEAYAFGSGASMSMTFNAQLRGNVLFIFSNEQNLFVDGSDAPIMLSGYYVDLRGNWSGSIPFSNSSTDGRYGLNIGLNNMGSITGIHGYNCEIRFDDGNVNFVFTYGYDTVLNDKLNIINTLLSNIHNDEVSNGQKLQQVINQIMTSNSSLNDIKSTLKSVLSESVSINAKLDRILELLDEAGNGGYAPSQEDKDTINNTEQQQDDLLTDNDPSNEISSINNNVLSFIQSAPNTLSFAKSIFERLVTGNFAVLVFASISLAVFPLLLGFFKGGRV